MTLTSLGGVDRNVTEMVLASMIVISAAII
jgi:hypothetical protein